MFLLLFSDSLILEFRCNFIFRLKELTACQKEILEDYNVTVFADEKSADETF